jgi:tetratricopeptide (TPR) repeat protein
MQKIWFLPLAFLYLAVIFTATSGGPRESRGPASHAANAANAASPRTSVPLSPAPSAKPQTLAALGSGDLSDPKIAASRRLFFDALSARDTRRAESLLSEAVSLDPSFESARERLAHSQWERGDAEGARRNASACLGLNPRNWGCHRSNIEALTALEGEEIASSAVRDCLDAKPGTASSFCFKRLREYHLKRGTLEQFEAEVRSAFAGAGRDAADEAVLRASFYEEVGDVARARANYDEACDAGSDYACETLKLLKKT